MTRFNSHLGLKNNNDVELGKNFLSNWKKKERRRDRQSDTEGKSVLYFTVYYSSYTILILPVLCSVKVSTFIYKMSSPEVDPNMFIFISVLHI